MSATRLRRNYFLIENNSTFLLIHLRININAFPSKKVNPLHDVYSTMLDLKQKKKHPK